MLDESSARAEEVLMLDVFRIVRLSIAGRSDQM
jgi:hypothetical protein